MTKTKNKITTYFALASAVLSTAIAPIEVSAEETNSVPKIKIEEGKAFLTKPYLNSSWKTKYLGQRGFTISETPVLQTDAGVTLGNVSYDLWANYDISKHKLNEVDNTLSVPALDSKDYRVTLSAIHFNSPSRDFHDALETGIKVTRKNLPLDISVFGAQIFGYQSGGGQVFNFEAKKSIPLSKRASLSLTGRVWYNNSYFVTDHQSGFSHASLTGNLSLDLGHNWTLDNTLTAQKAIESFRGTFKDQVVYGISLTKQFK